MQLCQRFNCALLIDFLDTVSKTVDQNGKLHSGECLSEGGLFGQGSFMNKGLWPSKYGV